MIGRGIGTTINHCHVADKVLFIFNGPIEVEGSTKSGRRFRPDILLSGDGSEERMRKSASAAGKE